MRILFVNEKRGWFGGVEQNVCDTAAGLREAGHECFLAWGEDAREPERYSEYFAESAACREAGAGAGESLSAIAGRLAVEVVYFHKIPAIPTRQSLQGSPRMVRMVHDHDLCCPRRHKYFFHNARVCHHPAGWRCWLDLAWLERDRSKALGIRFRDLFAHKAEMRRHHDLDLCLVGSRFMKEELEMNGFPENRVRILPPVVKRERRTPTPVSADPHVLFVGQLIRGKGVDLMLRALANVSVPYFATIVGEGNARAELEGLAESLGLKDKVRFTGWVDNRAVDDFYEKARLLVVPVRWPEPFGMIGLEAMHRSRPVVAFATGGIPDWLVDGENGYLLSERDHEGLATAITKLLENRELADQMGRKGWEKVGEEFSFDRYITNLAIHLGGKAL